MQIHSRRTFTTLFFLLHYVCTFADLYCFTTVQREIIPFNRFSTFVDAHWLRLHLKHCVLEPYRPDADNVDAPILAPSITLELMPPPVYTSNLRPSYS